MRNDSPLARWTSMALMAAVLTSPARVAADTRTMAAQVAAAFDVQALHAFAVEVPDDPGRFISALYIGGHLLAISAVHPSPELVRREIAVGNYRQVYSVLSTSASREGRLFVEDFGEPGLHVQRDGTGSCDITWRDATRQTIFDGNWREQDLSEAEYHRRFASDEGEYDEMLHVLAMALQQRTGLDRSRPGFRFATEARPGREQPAS